MERSLFGKEHDIFRQSFRRFVEREIKPHQERWMAAGSVDRETWRKAGKEGFLCPWLPEEDGGPFVRTRASQEFAYDFDESNIAEATREPLPKTSLADP